jgi:hopanoid biosynthesis associated radical SAM protein HpnJ
MKVLFLNPPSFDRFDSAGARFAATRVTRSLWYPAWLAQAAALVPESRLIDCPADGLTLTKLLPKIKNFDLVVFYTSTPSFGNDVKVAERLKRKYPKIIIIFCGPHVSVLTKKSLLASKAINAIARREFEETILEVFQGKPWSKIKGLTFKKGNKIINNSDRPLLTNLDKIPPVSPIFKRDLKIRNYNLPFCLHPYVSIYAGRGCPNRCTFCLWPQTFTGRVYRKRNVDNAIAEVKWIKNNMPEVKEIFFDDDTFTVNHAWVRDFCQKIKPLKVIWSINARADVPQALLNTMKAAGCRFLIVGFESGDEEILKNIKKGETIKQMKDFGKRAKKAGLFVHGTFVLGLPFETKETIKKTLQLAKDLDCETLQVSIATPFPGTELYDTLTKLGYLKKAKLVDAAGYQSPSIDYPTITGKEIETEAKRFLIKFYLRPKYIVKNLKLALSSYPEAQRITRSAFEFFKYLFRED